MASLWWDDEPLVAQWVAEASPHVGGFHSGRAVGWVTDDGRLVGGLVMAPRGGMFDGELSIRFEKECQFTRAQLKDLFRIAFDEWGLKRLTCYVASENIKLRELLKRIGFKNEGKLRFGYDGRRDACLYGMTRGRCKWVE